jgi:hypothetical protein
MVAGLAVSTYPSHVDMGRPHLFIRQGSAPPGNTRGLMGQRAEREHRRRPVSINSGSRTWQGPSPLSVRVRE